MYDLVWSDHLLSEVERVLVGRKGLSVERAAYFCDWIRSALPAGRVLPESYLPLVATRTGPDPDDHVHSAAAIAGGATVVLSPDRTGYPALDIAPAHLRNPDTFLAGLLRRYPNDVLGVIDDMGGALRDPLDRAQILRRLAAAGAPVFAARADELG